MDKNSRIAIIGGGFSGLVIAYKLQSKGFTEVVVFEKNEQLGGKIKSIKYKQKAYELGALFGLPSQKNLKKLMKDLKIKADGPNLARENYNSNGKKIMQIPKLELRKFVIELKRLPEVLIKYRCLNEKNLNIVDKSLFLTFSKWCELNDFKVIKRVYQNYFTSYGLGNIEEIPALYVLKVLNYDNLMSFMELPEFWTWNNGTETIIKELEKRVKDVRLTQKVKQIEYCNNSINIKTQCNLLKFDYAIITAPLNQFADFYSFDNKIFKFLKSIKYQKFNVYAFSIKNNIQKCGFVLDNLNKQRSGHIVIWNSKWESKQDTTLLMVYAYEKENTSIEESLLIIKEDLIKLGFKDFKLYQYKRWEHAPYADSNMLEDGFYEKLNSVQGKRNVFLAGEIMSTISMENILEYSQSLINKYF